MITNPSLQKLHLTLGRSISSQFLGNYATKFKWDGLEFADVRAYIPGDPINRIDRKTSAKKWWDLYTKEFVEERQLRIRFVCDDTNKRKQHSMDEAVYALWYAAIRNGDRIGLINHKETVQLWGKRETLWRILEKEKKETKTKDVYNIIKHIIYWKSKSFDTQYKSKLEKKLRQIIHMKISETLVVIITDEVDIDHKLIRQVWEKNEILWVHIFGPEELSLDSESKYIQFGDRAWSLMVETDQDGQKYKDLVQKKLGITKRCVQWVWGRYLVINTKSDTVKELMRIMER